MIEELYEEKKMNDSNNNINNNTVNEVPVPNSSTSTPSEISQLHQNDSNFNNITNIPTMPVSASLDNNINTNGVSSPLEVNNNTVNIALDSISVPNDSLQMNQNMNNDMQQQNPNHTVQTNDEELLRAFIGDNYEKITTKSFNFAGFFFNTFYMFYRKMFGYALLVFLMELLIINLIKNFFALFIILVINAILGFLVNKVYLSYATRKIAKIKLRNQQKDRSELKGICSATGGTSIREIVLGFSVELVIVIIVLIVMLIMNFGSMISLLFGNIFSDTDRVSQNENSSSLNDNYQNSTEDASSPNDTYEGILSYNTSINMKDEFTITVPSKFKDISDSYEYEYEYSSGNGVFDDCSFKLSVPEGFSNAENLINQIFQYNSNDNSAAVTKATANNIDWYWFSLESSFGKTYYYGTTKNNKVFLLQYEINKNASNDCESYRQPIIDSIKSK